MQKPFRDLFKHSMVYGIGQALTRLGSFLVLPIYTSYLRPADYGVVAILDFTSYLLALVIGAGMAGAVARYHFKAKNEGERSQVWWTGLTLVLIAGVAVLFPAIMAREMLAFLTLGPTITEGGFYYALVLPTMGFNVLDQLLDGYLRVRKWSGLSVGVNLFRLVLNIGLNVYCLVVLELGVTGILIGNLITGIIITLVFFVIYAKSVGSYSFHYPLVRQLLHFGGPLVATVIMSALMQEVDRYLLRIFLDLEQVGIYSLARRVSQGIFTACVLPFTMIWGVLMYEIAEREDAQKIYVRVFEYFTYAIGLIMLGVSLFAGKLLGVMVAPDYLGAAKLIPILCLGYLLFGLHEHFKVPVMLAGKTLTLLPVVCFATLINIVANIGLIPIFGIAGAAWASVLTCAAFSFVGLLRYRRIDRYRYPFGRCGVVIGGMIVTYVMYEWVLEWQGESPQVWVFAIGSWLIWAILLGISILRQLGIEKHWASLLVPFRFRRVY